MDDVAAHRRPIRPRRQLEIAGQLKLRRIIDLPRHGMVQDEAIGLKRFDVIIEFGVGNIIKGWTFMPAIPPGIEDDVENWPILREQFRELVLDELDFLGRNATMRLVRNSRRPIPD